MPQRQAAALFVAVFFGGFAVALLATGHAVESLGALVLMLLALMVAYFDISELVLKMFGIDLSLKTRMDEKTKDVERVLGEVSQTVNHLAEVALSARTTLTASGTVTDEVGLTDSVTTELRRDLRPQLERVLGHGVETGFIAAKMGWQKVPRPVVAWPDGDGDPVISYLANDDPSDGATGHLLLGDK